VKANTEGSDNVDLKGVWAGDVSSILQTLGGKFNFFISKNCGSAPEKGMCKEKLRDFFNERDWNYSYYWCYYSGHGSSSGGAWCLPKGGRMRFEDIHECWRGSAGQRGGARLVIVSDSCYCGKLADACEASGARDIAVQASSVAHSTSSESGWSGGVFTKAWCKLIKDVRNGMSKYELERKALPDFKVRVQRQGSSFHIGWPHRRETSSGGISYAQIGNGLCFVETPKKASA
jgi:hypothetical protein